MAQREDSLFSDAPGDRRRFLKQGLATLGGAATALVGLHGAQAQTGSPSLEPSTAIDDESYWEEVRRQFHDNGDIIYMNNGSLGRCPKPVTQAVYDGYVQFGQRGHNATSNGWEAVNQSHEALASFLGADADEIALTRNATQGLQMIANGIRMEAGDAVLMTSDEHVAAYDPWATRATRFGIRVDRVRIPSPPSSVDEVVELFRRAITPETRVMAFCHVTRGPGMLYPVKELCQLAREHDLVTAVDGAQSPGMTPVDLHDMGCDLFATSLHKWALTPPGTGCLYIRKEFQDTFWPLSSGNGPWDGYSGIRHAHTQGTHELPIRGAIKTALEFMQAIGMENIYARDRMLSDYLKEQLAGIPGVRLGTSRDPVLASPGITAFSVDGWDTALLRNIIDNKYHIVCNRDETRFHSMIRISTHFYNTPEEIDILVNGLKSII